MRNNKGQIENVLAFLIAFVVIAIIAGFCWDYTINTWLAYAHKEQRIAFWQACLMGFVPFVGQFSIAGAVITWIIMLFL